jgi:hypothetical protein
MPAGSASNSSSRARDTTGGDVKIPKWLKLGPSTFLIDVPPCPRCDCPSQRSDALYTQMV